MKKKPKLEPQTFVLKLDPPTIKVDFPTGATVCEMHGVYGFSSGTYKTLTLPKEAAWKLAFDLMRGVMES